MLCPELATPRRYRRLRVQEGVGGAGLREKSMRRVTGGRRPSAFLGHGVFWGQACANRGIWVHNTGEIAFCKTKLRLNRCIARLPRQSTCLFAKMHRVRSMVHTQRTCAERHRMGVRVPSSRPAAWPAPCSCALRSALCSLPQCPCSRSLPLPLRRQPPRTCVVRVWVLRKAPAYRLGRAHVSRAGTGPANLAEAPIPADLLVNAATTMDTATRWCC